MVNEATTRTPTNGATKPPPPAISSRDEVELIWMFNEGAAALEKSNFGAVLERSELFAHRSIRCGACEGLGILSKDDLIRIAADPSLFAPRIETEDGSRPAKSGDWCPSCDGTGQDYERGHEYSSAQVTAQPKGIEEPGGGYEAGHHDLERYATISRRLVRVERESAALLGVLSQFYGPRGERCAGGHFSRQLAVMAETIPGGKVIEESNERRAPKAEAGRRSVKSAKPGSGQLERDYTDKREPAWEPLHRPKDQVLLTEVIADIGQPRPARTKLIREASEAAGRLVRSAQCLYTDMGSLVRRRQGQPQGGPCVTVGCAGHTVPPAEAPTARPQCPLCGRYEPKGEAARRLRKGAGRG